MVSINTNLSSLIVQNNLTKSTNALDTAIERMTTGFKINHAADNAAGYSIAQNMNSKISSYTVAEENASMGLDMLQTAMDSMDLISSNLQRIRDLAEQASNGTYGQDSLNAINSEVQARVSEINRIISNAEYNGIKILDGEGGGDEPSKVTGYFLKPITQLTEDEAVEQGYTIIKTKADLEAISEDMGGKYILMNDIDLENSCLSYSTDGTKIFTGELNGNGYVIKNLKTENSVASSLLSKALGAVVKNLGLENIDLCYGYVTAGIFGYATNSTIYNAYVSGESNSYGYGLISYGSNNTISDSYSDITFSISAICMNSSIATCSNVYWNTDKTTNPVAGSSTLAGATGVTTEELAALVINPSDQPGRSSGGTGGSSVTFQVGINENSNSQVAISLGLGLSGLSISFTTNEEARNALSTIDGYIQTVSSKQTEYGTAFNRLESAIESIGVSIDNLTSSLSTIRDADIAKESSQYIKAQILQQASATLLATANQSPAIALQLI